MKHELHDQILTISLEGRVDSANASQVEAELTEIRTNNPFEQLILDAENLEYISSAGLRVVLRVRKEVPTVKMINVRAEVYEILDMTGFTEMMKVEKGYRRLSVDGCEVIGQGANGKVYRIDSDTIIKVYFNADALPDIHRERELARRAFVLGIPTAIPYDVVRVGDSYGSVFELLNAKTFAQLVVAEPENADKYIALNAELLRKIHGTEVRPEDMPDMRDVALNWVEFLQPYLPEEDYNKLHALVEAVPVDHHMLHGDYHLKNVMMQNGETLLIDMDTLCQGDPVFEFASVWLAYLGYSELDHQIVKDFLGMDRTLTEKIWNDTIRLYFGTEDEATLQTYTDKARIIGYTRQMRRTIRRKGFETETGRAVIENCKQKLHELLPTVESLSFRG
ncbi:MAG: anti-sigma factor antagonist [Oscillibacter sp.]|nr:anti-sigma factor antagonist [Oscillibacter sp.]